MERFAPETMAEAILEAPAWARVGITAPTEDLRYRAADELARYLVDRLEGREGPSQDELTLTL